MSEKDPLSSSRHTGKRRGFILTGLLLATAIASGGYYLQNKPAAADRQAGSKSAKAGKEHQRGPGFGGHEDEDRPVVVAVETAIKGDFPVYVNGLGTVTALKTVTVRPRVDGELVKIAFQEGQMVKQGDLLAEIDPRPFQVQLQQAEGQLLRDKALLDNAEIDNQRYATLLSQDSIASQQTATQQALVKQYQGTVEMDKSAVNNAKLQLNYAQLTAPISGRAGLRQIDQGNIIHAGDANGLVVITQLQPISVVFTLPEDKVQALIQRWHTGQPLGVEAYDRTGKNRLAEGKVTAIDNQIDPTTGTLKVKAQFDNNEGALFANQFVNTKMHLETLPAVVLVPSAAIQHDTQGAFVYAVSAEKTVQIRRVTLGPGETADAKVAVFGNLAANEAVVVEGIDRLKDGSHIDIAQQDGQAVAASPESLAKPESKNEGKFRKRERRT